MVRESWQKVAVSEHLVTKFLFSNVCTVLVCKIQRTKNHVECVLVCMMQLYWDVEPVPTIITDRLLPRLVQLGVITAVSDIHQAVLNIYHKVLTISLS